MVKINSNYSGSKFKGSRFKVDALVKSHLYRHPGEPRIGACPGPRIGVRGRLRGPEHVKTTGFRLSPE